MLFLFISFFLFLVSYYFLPKNRKILIFFLFISVLYFLASIFFIIWNYFTWKWIDESVLYQLFSNAWWAWLDFKVIIIFILSILVSILFLSFFYFLPEKINFPKWKVFKILFIFFFISSFLFHPILHNFYTMWFFSSIKNEEKIFYEIPEVKKKTEKTKNLIYIYLESFEKLYLDEKLFPWVAKNLQNLKENSIYFENVEQAFWTNWTIAWMVWSQCWIPLINTWWWGNSMHWIKDFLPWAFCIWDYLKKAWYELSYFWWADLTFAWKWNFYKSHSFSNIYWKKELEKKLKDENYKNYWWLYDDSLFDFVFDEYDRLSSEDKSFWLFTITMDTHLNDAFVSKSCPKKDFDKEILKSYNCSDFLLWNFLERIKNHKNFKNTIIVISSDHYAMNANSTIDILNKNSNDRRNLFLIIDWEEKQKIYKNSTTLDIWPTILNKLWFEVNKLWFWVNIFSEEKWIENLKLRNYRDLFESFWSFPSLKNWIDFDLKNKKIFINWKDISFPALVILNKEKDTEKILWEDLWNWELIDKLQNNSIYFSFYKNWKFCLNFWKKSQKCFSESWKISYEDILKEF